jgi:hypothetical protein
MLRRARGKIGVVGELPARPEILIPAAARDPRALGLARGARGDAIDQLRVGGASAQIDAFERVAEALEVPVRILQARDGDVSVEIDALDVAAETLRDVRLFPRGDDASAAREHALDLAPLWRAEVDAAVVEERRVRLGRRRRRAVGGLGGLCSTSHEREHAPPPPGSNRAHRRFSGVARIVSAAPIPRHRTAVRRALNHPCRPRGSRARSPARSWGSRAAP